jgi:hypothetical protein
MRPIKLIPAETPSISQLRFVSFEFQQLFLGPHPGTSAITGEPSKGTRYFVGAKFYGEEAINTAKFEAVDEFNRPIEKIAIERQSDANGGSIFTGVTKVPARPFRVVVSGEGIDGKSYRLVYPRLFRPKDGHGSAMLLPPGARAPDAKTQQQYDAAVQQYMDKMEEDAKKNAGEMIVMPRIRVSNAMYAPYLSKEGRPLGLRITFDIEFSQDGYYNPELHLYPEYSNPNWRGRIDMNPLTGSIEPQPAEEGSPQERRHILAYGAGYIYWTGTTYHFTAEYIPNYVIQNDKKTKFCIWSQQYKYMPEMQSAWKAIMVSKAPTKYTLYINNTNFAGVIEGLHPQGTLLRNFTAEGAQDCGEQPTFRF